METAKYKTIPNYEYNREGVYALFNGEGILVTNDQKVTQALDKAKPFIQRIDKPEPKPAAKPKPKSKAK